MHSEPTRFDAVLFDCDGVLVDSEPITNGILRDMLEEAGWSLTPQDCMRLFVGKAVKDERALIESHTGQPLTEAWLAAFRERRNQQLLARLEPIRQAPEAVAAVPAPHGGSSAASTATNAYTVHRHLTNTRQ